MNDTFYWMIFLQHLLMVASTLGWCFWSNKLWHFLELMILLQVAIFHHFFLIELNKSVIEYILIHPPLSWARNFFWMIIFQFMSRFHFVLFTFMSIGLTNLFCQRILILHLLIKFLILFYSHLLLKISIKFNLY
jgi:hypothetical protein